MHFIYNHLPGIQMVHVGELMRISVRPATKIIASLGVSRADKSVLDTTGTAVLYGG